MIKISKKRIIIIAIILIIAGFFIFNSIFKKNTDGYVIVKVEKGTVLQNISETGNVKATDNIKLGFKSAGRIESINVLVGENVKKGGILAKLDANQLSIQLQEAKAALDVSNRQYDKLLNGATPEDVKIVEDSKIAAEDDLNSAYGAALNTLNDAYTKIYNAYAAAISIQNSYFSASDQQGIKVIDNKNIIQDKLSDVKFYLDAAKNSQAKEDIDFAISRMLTDLNVVYDALRIARDMCDEGVYYSKVSATDKTSLDTQKTNINTVLTSVTASQQDISSYKIALQKAESSLALKLAKPRQEDIDLHQAQIRQAEAKVALLQSQIQDAYLRSPIDAKITKIDIKTGEIVSTNSSVVSLLSSNPFQIKADIYEQDIVNIKIDNTVAVSLIAFPKKTFSGKVILIDPAEKIVDNVVYYEITIDFDGSQEGIKSGMTADIVIETNKKDNVLRISKNAVEKISGAETAQVIKSGKIENRKIETGLEGEDYFEVLSGLSEGDEVVIGKK
ncbi:MAG: hypothetical protein CEN87_310 [Parcubacteria group bacterium Licking1014_1]|nr:MAG: hypothetical protein CEN87_310 [Parcubacteria group bacterium Licking1014_1]